MDSESEQSPLSWYAEGLVVGEVVRVVSECLYVCLHMYPIPFLYTGRLMLLVSSNQGNPLAMWRR